MDLEMSLELILTEISNINKNYEEIAKKSGENFNIFNILDLTSKELIHSKVIAMLLNPKGEHNMGNCFLKLFVETIADKISQEKDINIDYDSAKVFSEKTFNNGRFDILVTTKTGNIIIENKIYAEDQNNQLLRYYEYDNNAILLYLTLKGTLPDKISTKNEKKEKELKHDEDYFCISYQYHILEWLENCKKEIESQSFIRETINQYILLVKQLTGQGRNRQMLEKYTNVITKNKENIEAAFFINNSFDNIKRQMLRERFAPLITSLAEYHGLKYEWSKKDFLDKWWGVNLFKNEWENKIIIRFEFQESNLRGLVYGICGKSNINQKFKEYLLSIEGYNRSSWLLFKGMDNPYRNWDNAKFYIDLFSDNKIAYEVFNDKINELLKHINNYKGDI